MDDNIIDKILNSILAFAQGDLETKIEMSGKEEELDAIALGLNMLGEELLNSQKTIIERENKILKSNNRFKRVVENISDGLVAVDLSNKVVYANDRSLHMFGLSRDDIGYEVVDNLIAPEFRTILLNQFKIMVAGEDIPDFIQFKGIRKDGQTRWFEVRVSKIIENDVLEGFQYTIRDITEQKENFERLKVSEAEKTKLLNELTIKYNELMQFNYIVSHNLRVPIANIIGLSNVLSLPELDEAEKPAFIEAIRTSAYKMDELVKDLSVILSARSTINSKKETVSVYALLYSITDTLAKQIKESGTVIKINIADEAKEIFTIKSFLQSILFNLLSNAIKYKSPSRVPEIVVTANKTDNEIIILVSDNGLGIDLIKHGQYIFGLYKRFHMEAEGRGLGLNMTKTQVEALGGKIWVESQPDKGTTFTVSIPVV